MSETIHQDIYERLKEAARNEELLTYGQIAPLANLNLQSPADRNRISLILGEISTYEHENNRPLLSAIVILKGEDKPAEGFFRLARELGRYSGRKDKDDCDFFTLETKRVFEYWQNH